MRTDLRCVLEGDPTDPVIRLVGVLDRHAVDDVRAALLGLLADRAAPVAVDVSEVRDAAPGALLRFGEVARTVAEWPAGGFVCCAAPSGTDRAWSAAGLTVLPDATLAAALVAGAPAAAPVSAELDPVVGAARTARVLLAEGCRRWGVPHLAEPAAVALTELVNNVVVHAGTPMSVRIGLRDGCLRMSVRDGSDGGPPAAVGSAPVAPTALGGRGILLVDSVARRWGCTRLAVGKLVWAAIGPTDHPQDGD